MTGKHHEFVFPPLPQNPGSLRASPECEPGEREGEEADSAPDQDVSRWVAPNAGGGHEVELDSMRLAVPTPIPGHSCPGLAAPVHVPWWQVALADSSLAAGLEKSAERRGGMGRGQRQAAAPLPPCSRGCIHYPCLGANRDAPSCLFTLSFCKPRAHLLRVKVAQPEAEEEAGFAGHSGPPDGYPPRGEGGGRPLSSRLPFLPLKPRPQVSSGSPALSRGAWAWQLMPAAADDRAGEARRFILMRDRPVLLSASPRVPWFLRNGVYVPGTGSPASRVWGGGGQLLGPDVRQSPGLAAPGPALPRTKECLLQAPHPP